MYFYAENKHRLILITFCCCKEVKGYPNKLKRLSEKPVVKYIMSDLDFLKGSWNRQIQFPIQTKEELQRNIRKSSLNVLKWLIAVNFFELLLFIGLSVLLGEADNTEQHSIINGIVNTLDFMIYTLPILFSGFYFILIKRIGKGRSVSSLLQNIFTARKFLNLYIYLNIALFLIILYVAIFLTISAEHIDQEAAGTIGTTTSYVILISICILVSLLFMLAVWLFYRLLYGRLLQKLNRNYEELKDME